MLLSLYVKNLALIDETEVEFGPGLNILTGETGAGKSIVIGGVNLALGAKAEKDLIRTGADYALIELVFRTERADVLAKMEELELLPQEDGTITISRRIQENRSVCKINGEAVSVRVCRELSELLIDIHGQHEHESLLHKRKHLEILDAYCAGELAPVLARVRDAYRKWKELEDELSSCAMDEQARKKELALAEFECREIEEARLAEGEEEELERRFQKMENARRIMQGVAAAHQCLGYEASESAGNQIDRAMRELKGAAVFDGELEDGVSMLADVDGLLNDLNRFLSEYMGGLEFEEEDFASCEDRLNLVNHLRSRYGGSVRDILAYAERQRQKIETLRDLDAYRENLAAECEKSRAALLAECARASEIRAAGARKLEKQLKRALTDLNFMNVEFLVEVRGQGHPGPMGADEAEFMISTNPGEPMKPLAQIASGGELSRVMLALKTVFAGKDAVETLIFDEIDSGISGRTAWRVSRKLGELGRQHQVICITHLPQIAANADKHFLIEKATDGRVTTTKLRTLGEEEGIRELARMLGGETMTDAVLENAREIRRQARQ